MSQQQPSRPGSGAGHGVAISMSFVFESTPDSDQQNDPQDQRARGVPSGGRRSNIPSNWLSKMPSSWSKAVTDDLTTMRSGSALKAARPLSDAYLASMNRSKRSRTLDSRPTDRTDGPRYSKSRYSKTLDALKEVHEDTSSRQQREPNQKSTWEKIAKEAADSDAVELWYKEKLADAIIKRTSKDSDYDPKSFVLVEQLKNGSIKL